MINGIVSHGIALDLLLKHMEQGYALFEALYNEDNEIIDFKYTMINEAFEKICSISSKDLIGRTIEEVNEKLGKERNYLVKLRDYNNFNKDKFKYDIKLVNKVFSMTLFNLKKQYYFGLVSDITDFSIIKESLEEHRVLFEIANDIILYLDEEGNIKFANKNALEAYGYSLDELLSLNINDIRHHSMQQNFNEHMNSSEDGGITFEGIHVRKDGSSFPVEVSSKTAVVNNSKTRIHIIRNISERKMAEKRILQLANFDVLTGIANRSNIMGQLESNIERAKENDRKVALILFDIDRFKLINDTYGHQIGDVVLQGVAKKVQRAIRNTDSIGRLGGDEFIIILPLIDTENDILTIINRIFKELEEPIIANNNSIHVKISMGVSIYTNGNSSEELIRQADEAMYSAKKQEGCSYKFFIS